jgi:hypothetical protein
MTRRNEVGMEIADIHEAKSQLSWLIDRAMSDLPLSRRPTGNLSPFTPRPPDCGKI